MTEDYETALNFMLSPRGQYIMGQALWISIDTMKRVPAPYTEHSNIADMEFIMDSVFPMFAQVKKAEQHFQEQQTASDETDGEE